MRIIYLDIDSLRPDHLGCYGYHRNTSPHIDAIAAQGLRMDRVFASDAPCLPSRTALYSGRFGIHTGVVSHGGSAAEPWQDGKDRVWLDTMEKNALPTVLQEQGYYTAMISPFGQRHAARHIYAGFNEIHNTGQRGNESAEVVTPVVEKWLKDHATQDNWYLHLNYWDPHTPYRTPEAYPNHFADEPIPPWLTAEVFAAHRNKVGPHSPWELNMFNDEEDPRYPKQPGKLTTHADVRLIYDGYDNGVRYVDDQVGRIVQLLQEAGVYEDTALIISADHGENLGELGIYAEHGSADYFTSHIPMIIRWPGVTQPGSTDQGLHYHLDLAPTLTELVGGQPRAIWDGRSYRATLTEGAALGRDHVIVSECTHLCQRAALFEDWIYIRTYHDGFNLFPQEMLFDLKNDPYEQRDLASQEPALCDRGLRLLTEWQEAMLFSSPRQVDPLWTVIKENGIITHRDKLPAYCERLQATGRGWAVPELRKRHPGEFPS